MKFAFKVTLSALTVMILAVSIGSYALITLSFRTSLERETKVAQEELKMLRGSYEALCGARGVTIENLDASSRGVNRAAQESPYFRDHQFRVTGPRGVIYSNLPSQSDSGLLELTGPQTSAYVIRCDADTDQIQIHCAGPVLLPDGVLYMETARDISSIYAARETHYTLYRWVLLAVAFLGGGLLLIISTLLTRPIKSLEKGAQRIAQGDYSSRVPAEGSDEVSLLAESFNHMAETVEKNIEALEEAAQHQEDFTASFVHELKTPLTSIIGYADILRSQELPEELRLKAAGYIFSEGKRLENLSLSLMTLLVVGHTDEDMAEISAQRLCETVRRAAQPSLAAHDLQFSAQAEDGAILGDMSLLETLLINLLDNARKASPPGSTVTLTGQRLPKGYRFTVEDQGRGIPEQDLKFITEPFYMADKSRSRAEGGAGLGLSLCRRIVELHHGVMTFESREGDGTRVQVTLGGGAHA